MWAIVGMVASHSIRSAFIEDPSLVALFMAASPPLVGKGFLEALQRFLERRHGRKRWSPVFLMERIFQLAARHPIKSLSLAIVFVVGMIFLADWIAVELLKP